MQWMRWQLLFAATQWLWAVPCKKCNAAIAKSYKLGAVNKGSQPPLDRLQHFAPQMPPPPVKTAHSRHSCCDDAAR